jgi:hypothetical protein
MLPGKTWKELRRGASLGYGENGRRGVPQIPYRQEGIPACMEGAEGNLKEKEDKSRRICGGMPHKKGRIYIMVSIEQV